MLLCLSVAVVSCKEADVEVQSITITPSDNFSLVEGETQELTAVVTPADATNPAIMWESSDPTVASIEGSTVTAHMRGTTTLTATASNGLSESVELAVSPAGGVVVEDGWWKIYDAMGLAAFRDAVNGVVETSQPAINGKLMADIYLDGVEWTPIGILDPRNPVGFKGDFDGNDKKIFGLKIDADTTEAGTDDKNSGKALFSFISGELESGTVVSYASVKDLTIVSPEIYGYEGIAVLTAGAYGVAFENCHIDGGVVKGASDVGGIMSFGNLCSLDGCSNSANVTALSGNTVGGIAASFTNCEITNCVNSGNIEAKVRDAGGISGTSNMTNLTKCINIGDVSSETGSDIGGIVGRMNITNISYCTNKGNISGVDELGGIVGDFSSNSSVIFFSENQGDVTSQSGDYVGGIAGNATPAETLAIYGCVNSGGISGETAVGGLVGRVSFVYLGASYNIGSVTANDSLVGGIFGTGELSDMYGAYNIGAVVSTTSTTEVGGVIGGVDNTESIGYIYWVPSADGDAVDAIGSEPSMTEDIETTLEALNGAALIDSLNVGVERFITEFNAITSIADITDDIKVEFVMGDDGYPVLQKVN